MVDTYTWRDLENRGHVSSFQSEVPPIEKEYVSRKSKNSLGEDVLKAFRLNPEACETEQIGKVYRVTSSSQKWALKEVDPASLKRLLQFHHFSQNGPIRTPPLILAESGTPYYLNRQNKAYILMPWVNGTIVDSSRSHEALWETLAEWHRTTGETCEVDSDWAETFSARCLEIWSEQVLTLDLFMNDSEHRVYPSPFEQRFMAFYSELRRGAEVAYEKLTEWKETVREAESVRVVFCHGKPSPAHLITSGHQHNWVSNETAGHDLPIRDLTWLLRWGIPERTVNEAHLTHGLNLYETTFPMEDQEKLLLEAQTCHPARLVSLLHRYKDGKGRYLERDYTVELERTYHQWGRTWHAVSRYLANQKQESISEKKDSK